MSILPKCPIESCGASVFLGHHPQRGPVEICENGHVWALSQVGSGRMVAFDPKKAAANDSDE